MRRRQPLQPGGKAIEFDQCETRRAFGFIGGQLVRPVRVLGFCGDGCYTQCPTRQIGVLFVRWALGAQRWAITTPSASQCPTHAVSGLSTKVLFHETAVPAGVVAVTASSSPPTPRIQ